jgi:hypothetical protein
MAFADLKAAHAFLDYAEQAREGTVYLRGLELARGALEQANRVTEEVPGDQALLAARDQLRDRLSALARAMSPRRF